MLPLCRECSMNTTHYFLRSIFNISPGERSDASRGCKLLYLAMVLYHARDIGGAIMQQHKELIINDMAWFGPP
ncbi:hypothetical protein VitviT2T_030597 [Vitis vinifera]|uniref:Uncharacterized protein n=1 Tax=Vitis vinifera TaxID=29760 RepID=A0ABY9E1E5_VITVI|nr:hypothetical protein VitviT2T_030597 [Vitis vinifera]